MTSMAYWRAQIDVVLEILDIDAEVLERPAADELVIRPDDGDSRIEIINALGRVGVLTTGTRSTGLDLHLDITQDQLEHDLEEVPTDA